MQLANVPKPIISLNKQVAGAMSTAHDLTAKVQSKVENGNTGGRVVRTLADALDAATQARDGVGALGKQNLLDGTFQRYSVHAVRHLEDAVRMLGDGSHGVNGSLTKALFDAEVSTRLASNAADRSLANPSPKALERATSGSGSSSGPDGGMSWVDGEWLDGLGNPVRGRGGDSWTGPDGETFGRDGGVSRGDSGGSFVGPDGASYSDSELF